MTAFAGNGQEARFDPRVVENYSRGIYSHSAGEGGTIRGTYRIDPRRVPPQLDYYLPNRDEPVRCIYRLNGDTLTMAYSSGDSRRRPDGFGDRGLLVETYKRVR